MAASTMNIWAGNAPSHKRTALIITELFDRRGVPIRGGTTVLAEHQGPWASCYDIGTFHKHHRLESWL